MPQTQNKFKLFLLAIFCLALFGGAGEARAANPCLAYPIGFHILPDGRTCENGNLVYLVNMYYICGEFVSGAGACDANLAKNPEFKYDWTENYTLSNKYQAAGKYWGISSGKAKGGSVPASSSYLGFIRDETWIVSGQAYKDTDSGLVMADEPGCISYNIDPIWGNIEAEMQNMWTSVKPNYPNQILLMNNWRCFDTYIPMVDLFSYDSYTNSNGWVAAYGRDNIIYAEEMNFASIMKKNGSNPWSTWPNKNIGKTIDASTSNSGGFTPYNQSEIRPLMWDIIATGAQHLSIYGYDVYPASNMGLIQNSTMRQWYGDVASEIKSLEPILTLPTKTYSWEGYRDDLYVSITPNLEKNNIWPGCGWCFKTGARRFTYLLKQPDPTHSYLIVVNKDKTPSGNVEISVNGIPATATVKTLGILGAGSGAAGRTLTATNGKFIDSFDSYAVHIYQICLTGNPCTVPVPPPPTPDTTLPEITITRPPTAQTYSSPTISLSGTASDNVGVSKVEVKVGSAGAYQTATGTTSWSISGITIVAGLNMVYAKVTDTASPPNTKEVFIQVTYDSTTTELPPSCIPTDLCGNGLIDTGETCDTLGNLGCSPSSACNSSCAACVPVVTCSPIQG